MDRRHLACGLFALGCMAAGNAQAVAIAPAFAGDYTVTSLGSVPGLPPLYGGLTFKLGDPNTILIGGNANTAAGLLYEIGVVRDVDNHITGFSGTATAFGNVGEFNDGGVVYGPNDVLFTAQWNVNNLGQTLPGSTDEDRVDDLAPFGIGGSSISALGFVPAGFSNAGAMKVVSWSAGNWYDVEIAPDGAGTFDILSATQVDLDPVAAGVQTLPGGPEGFAYVNGPGFTGDSMLVSDFSAGRVSAYQVDADGDPILTTRQDFVIDLTGAEGAAIDPLTGDFLFSTFGGGNQVVVVEGFENDPGTGSITGVKWEDLDADGLIDVGEALLSGVEIQLLNNLGDIIATTVTIDGTYGFDELFAGLYGVREILPDGSVQTFDATAGGLLTLAIGQSISDVNFGNRPDDGTPPPPPPPTGVPLPGTLLLLGLGVVAWCCSPRADPA